MCLRGPRVFGRLAVCSTILLRNLSVANPFTSPTNPFRVSGNASIGARVDTVVYEGAQVAGQPLSFANVQAGMGELVTNVSVCDRGCGEAILPASAVGWSRAQVCGRTPQPAIAGKQFPSLTRADLQPWCAAASGD